MSTLNRGMLAESMTNRLAALERLREQLSAQDEQDKLACDQLYEAAPAALSDWLINELVVEKLIRRGICCLTIDELSRPLKGQLEALREAWKDVVAIDSYEVNGQLRVNLSIIHPKC